MVWPILISVSEAPGSCFFCAIADNNARPKARLMQIGNRLNMMFSCWSVRCRSASLDLRSIPGCRVAARCLAGLVEDARHVSLHGVRAQVQLARDDLVALTLGHPL